MKGSYILILQLERPLAGLQIGRLGSYDFAAGWYLYVGSAQGPGGVGSRLRYHLRRQKARPHWHIDYLRAQARLREAWTVTGLAKLECTWCRALREHPSVSAPVPGFGSRDTGCYSHLFHLPSAPRPSLMSSVVLSAVVAGTASELQIEIHSFDEAES